MNHAEVKWLIVIGAYIFWSIATPTGWDANNLPVPITYLDYVYARGGGWVGGWRSIFLDEDGF